MTKLDSNEIIKLLDNLIGQTEDSLQKEQAEKNLMTLIDVADWCMNGIVTSADTACDVGYAMYIVGCGTKLALTDYKKWLKEAGKG